ncbi:hypothetical protein ABPG74_015593 [Tetrahymena malaccensis]
MESKKITIACILAYLSFLSCYSCISSVSLPLRIFPTGQVYSEVYGPTRCMVQFVPNLSYCSNVVKETTSDMIECEGVDLGRSPFYSYGEEFTLKYQLGNTNARLNFTVLDNLDSISESELCFIQLPEQAKNDNVIDQLYSQGLIEVKKFYFNFNNIKHQTVVGSIDIGNPNYQLIKQGQQFTTLKPYTGNQGYYASSDGNMNYGSISLFGYDSVGFNVNDPYIQIPEFSLKLILQEFKRQGIAYVYQPTKNYALYVNSISKLQNIQIDLAAEDGSVFTLNLKPQYYSRQLYDGTYQVLLYPTFYNSNLSIGYSALQAYYVGFDFISHKIEIVEKANNNNNDSNINPY